MLRAQNDRIVVKPNPTEIVTPGGIILPDVHVKRPESGKVLSVGKLSKGSKFPVAVGDDVIYAKNAGWKLRDNGEEVIVLNIEDVLGINRPSGIAA